MCSVGWRNPGPRYGCITEGSGGNGTSRIASTTALLVSVGAARGPIFGRYRDKEVSKLLEYFRHHTLDFLGAHSGESGCRREYDEPEH